MKIIGHRGAAGLAPENTLEAINAGIAAGADAVEFDVRLTNDDVFVLNHDSTLLRTAGSLKHVKNQSLAEIEAVEPFKGEPIPTLDEALLACFKVFALIEPKGKNWAEPLAETLREPAKSQDISVIAFNHTELIAFHSLLPDVPCYALERSHVISAIHLANSAGLKGVNLRFLLLNPITYWYARLMQLDIIIHTIDQPILMRYFRYFYPKVAITTNYPNVLKRITSKKK